jgi:hypothetical protein
LWRAGADERAPKSAQNEATRLTIGCFLEKDKMKQTLAFVFLSVIANLHGLAEERVSNIPMTNPGLVLATHEQNYGHSVNFLELPDGRILMNVGKEFRISNDSGMTWSEAFVGRDENGQPLDLGSMSALVRLSGKSIGAAHARPMPGRSTTREWEMLFRHSEDTGKIWSAPVVMNPHGPTAVCLQDVFCVPLRGASSFQSTWVWVSPDLPGLVQRRARQS